MRITRIKLAALTEFLGVFKLGTFSLAVLFLSQTAEASITFTSNIIGATANDRSGGPVNNFFSSTTIPTSTSLDAIDGNTYSKNSIDWAFVGGEFIMSLNMQHQRNGLLSALSQSTSNTRFTANSNSTYELSGYYYATDAGANVSRVAQSVVLLDLTASTALFQHSQESLNSANEQFTLGTMGGDTTNILVGNLTGPLIAGHEYRLAFSHQLHASPDADQGATALGNFTFKVTENTAMPEPFSIFVWGGLIASAVFIGQRNRTNH
jgi:hypothetical protein